MNRRDSLVALLVLASVTGSVVSLAQRQSKVWRIGFLVPRRRPDSLETDILGGFPRGMRELGYVEGRDFIIEWRFADGSAERLTALAAELIRLRVDVIVCGSSQGIRALQQATTTLPIVMATSGDPIGSGFVTSLARPGGNITGLSNLLGDVSPKHLELLSVMVPKLSRVATLFNPVNPSNVANLNNVRAAAQKVNVRVLPIEAVDSPEIENGFSVIAREGVEAVIVTVDTIFIQQRRQIAQLATRLRLPSVSGIGEYAEAGGLMSYGPNFADQFRRAATYVDKILKRAKPGDLPVEQSTTLELVVNKQTAKSIGLTIPQAVLIRADRVLE